MRHARLTLIAVASVCTLLSACATTTSGTGAPVGVADAATGSSGSTPAKDSTDSATIALLLARGSASITTAHLTLTTAGSASIVAVGDETLANGELDSLSLSETVQGTTIQIRIIGTDSWAQVPGASTKPWLLLSPTSSVTIARTLAGSLSQVRSQTALTYYAEFLKAAKNITIAGHEQVNGADSTHYALVVDVTKLPSDTAAAAIKLGLTTIPVNLWIDAQGRPVQLTDTVQAQGVTVSIRLELSKFNQPVTITAPPADQVQQ